MLVRRLGPRDLYKGLCLFVWGGGGWKGFRILLKQVQLRNRVWVGRVGRGEDSKSEGSKG